MKILMRACLALGLLLSGAEAHAEGFFRGFTGSYQATLQIGDKTFQDSLEILSVESGTGLHRLNGKVNGTYTVPGVFTAAIEEGTIQFTQFARGTVMFRFRITAVENGESYPVYFKLTTVLGRSCEMVGDAYLDEKLERHLGRLRLLKSQANCEIREY